MIHTVNEDQIVDSRNRLTHRTKTFRHDRLELALGENSDVLSDSVPVTVVHLLIIFGFVTLITVDIHRFVLDIVRDVIDPGLGYRFQSFWV